MSPIKFIILTEVNLKIKIKIIKGICLPNIGRANSLVRCLNTNNIVLDTRSLDILKANRFEVELKNRSPNPAALQFKANILLV